MTSIDDKMSSLVDFRGAQIPHDEAEILKELEALKNGEFKLIDEISYTPMSFLVENNHVSGLSLYFCNLENIPDSIGNLEALKIFFLNGNNLCNLPESIGCLKELHRLELDNNMLKCLPDSIKELESLSYLNLSVNQIESLPECICNIKKLSFLDLSNNQLEILPESTLNLVKLNTLWLEGNKINVEKRSTTRTFIEVLLFNGVDVNL